jgi:hypothetical protein
VTAAKHFPPFTEHDETHRRLAMGAVNAALEQQEFVAELGYYNLNEPTSDVVTEAVGAWLMTGLLHESYSERDQNEIVSAIIGRVATVLVLVGWQPPARLLAPSSPVEGKTTTEAGQ